MPLPWSNNDERNYIFITKIVSGPVREGLRTIFKREWNNRYQATLGAWDDTPFSGQALFNLEHGRATPTSLSKFQNGNTKEWDCTLLCEAILSSNSIGCKRLNHIIKNEVHKLRIQRNNIIHVYQSRLTDHEFEAESEKARKSFQALGLSTKEIENIEIERKRFTSFQVLPPQPTHEVMQRSEQVSAIIDDLNKLSTSNDSKLTYFYISGNPGSGKSQLARLIGESHYNKEKNKPSGLTFVMTLIAQNLDTLLESYEDFALRLNCAENVVASIINSDQTKEVKIRHLRSQIATRIKSYKTWLIIVDGVENLALVSALLPQLRDEDWNGGQVLVTTQETSSIPPNGSFTKHVSVSSGMGVTESCHLLATLSGTGDSEDPMLAEVANRLDYQPLAMAGAAVYFNQVTKVSPEFSWHNYLGKLNEGKRLLTEEHLRQINPAYLHTMTTAIILAVGNAAETDEVLDHTFHFLSLASHEFLPLDVVINYVLRVTKDQDKEQVGIKIRKSPLILSEDGEDISIRLHRVVHDALKLIYISTNENKEIITSSFHAATRAFYMFKDRKDEKTLVPHLKTFHIGMTTNTLWTNKTLYLENPCTEIREIFLYFGSVLRHYGEFLLSKEFLTAALDICMEMDGPDHLNAGFVSHNLGNVYQDLGDLQKAEQYHERGLDIFIKQLGCNHVHVAASYSNLGNVHNRLGHLQQAEQYYERALDIRTKQLGSNHVDVATSNNNLGSVYKALGDLQQAKQYFEGALGIRIKQLGSNHVRVAQSYNNVGTVYNDLGDLQQAKQYHERALDIHIKQLGPNHVHVAASYNNLGIVHNKSGDLQQVEQYHERALGIRIKQLGSNHVHVAASYNNLGIVHNKSGDLQQAEQYHERALGIRIKQLGPNHPKVATSYSSLGIVYKKLGELQKAKECDEFALDIRPKRLKSSHVNNPTSVNNLSNVHQDMSDQHQAKHI